MISLAALSKDYQTDVLRVPVLRDVSLSIEQGEFVAIMGPSGSGKSTLMNVIGCLDRFNHGSLSIGKHAIYGVDNTEAAATAQDDATLARIRTETIGFVFQGFNLIPRMNAGRNVELPMMYSGLPTATRHARALELLADVGLADRVDHLPAQLSGGQQQRVAIARALANRPLILIADEPTGSLDSATSNDILALFEGLHRSGMTILMVTHDQPVAARADRIIRLMDGRIVNEDDVA